MNLANYLFERSKYLQTDVIVGTDERISYPALFEQVKKVSYFLSQNFKRGDKIGILSENSSFFIASYLGIIKAGCIAIPFDKRISTDDAREIVSLCQIQSVFAQKKFIKKLLDIVILNEDDLKKMCLESISDNLLNEYDGSGDDLAVIVFTSGSTRRQKGVMLSHKNIITNTESIIEYLQLTEKDRIEVVLPFFYCYGTSLLHTHLRVGGSMVLNKSIFIGSVIKEINEYECTGFAGVPTTFQILLRKTDFIKNRFPTLRYITQAGGRLADCFIEELRDGLPTVDIVIMYGQTEATARLSYLPPNMLKSKVGSIGKGIPGVELKVVNKEGDSVSQGEVGEIIAKGDNIMLGYYNDAKETEKVLKNGYLCTGDLATIDDDGYIYITSREKDIIKSAGYRVNPKEIEDLILSCFKIIDCAVLGIEDDLLGEAIVVYIVAKDKDIALINEIESLCNEKLPSYKNPKYIEFIDMIPLNSSMKVDKPTLREIARKQFL
jgi:acyl-CoA synthetase (AMP-forming)/AMP-acid ligase II